MLLAIDDLPVQQKLLLEGRFSETEARQSREESFALTFRGPGEWPLRQRAYMLSHPKLGKLELFLVPVGKVEKDPAWRDYVAVFNRMH